MKIKNDLMPRRRVWCDIQLLGQHRTALIVFIITFLVVLPLLFKDNPHSPYSKYLSKKLDLTKRLEKYKIVNDHRYHRDIGYLSHLSSDERNKLSEWEESSKFKILVTIITTSRGHHGSGSVAHYDPNYLTQVLARYFQLELNRTSLQLTDLKVLICDVDHVTHQEAELLSSHSEVLHIHTDDESLHKFELEKRDYVNCLNHSVKRGADFIMLVEDDAMPHYDLLDKLDYLLQYRLANRPFGFVKLFHPTRLNGFITPDINRLAEWFALAGILEHLLTALLYLWQIDSKPSWQKRILKFIYFIMVLLAIGRINIEHFRTLSPHLYRLVPTPSCCTPALLFSPAGAQLMVDYLSAVTCRKGFAKDSAIDAFVKTTRLDALFFEPKLFTHIGVYTTLNDRVVDPAIVD